MNKAKLLLLLLFPLNFFGQINLTSGTYTETFGTGSVSAWTDNSTFPGWYLAAGGTFNFVATTNITATAPSNTGGFYTYTCNGTSDLKLGTRPSNGSGGTAGTGVSYMGMRLKNTTGATITGISVSFEAFQLSKAENDCNINSLTFSYRVGTTVTSLTSGTWIDVPALDYTAPNNDCSGGTSAQLVGYPCTVSSILSGCISVSIPANSEIVLRWGDINNQANDPHLAIDNITVTPLQAITITSSGSTTFCQGDSVTLTASGSSSYSWQPGGATTSSITVSTAGTYSVTAAGSVCPSQQATQTVTVNPAPVISGTATIVLSSCGSSNGSVTGLSATGPGTLTYTWSDGSSAIVGTSTTTADLVNQPAGNYTLLVSSSSNTCSISAGPYSIGNTSAPAAPSAGSNGPLCEGSALNLTAGGTGGTYSWSGPNSFNSSLQNPTVSSNATTAMSGDYFVTETVAGCVSLPGMVHVDVNNSVDALFIASPVTGLYPLAVNFTNNSSASANAFVWNFGDNSTSTATSPSVVYQNPGTYLATLTATTIAGCTDVYSVTIVVLADASSVQMPNVFSPNGDGINDEFKASAWGIDQFECKIYDRWGIPMTTISTVKSGWDGRVTSGSMASDGVYFYIMKAKGTDGKEYAERGYVQLISK